MRRILDVLSVIRVHDLDEAIGFANDTDYALTADFLPSPANIEASKPNGPGNVYINRS